MIFSKVDIKSSHFDIFVGTQTNDETTAICEWAYNHLQAAAPFRKKKGAVIFDVDDTLVDSNFEEIAPVCTLYKKIGKTKIQRFVVTARPERAVCDTAKELKSIDSTLPHRTFHMPLLTSLDNNNVSKKVAKYKKTKRKLIETTHKHKVLLSIGDQWWDLFGSEEMLLCVDGWIRKGIISNKKCYVIFPTSDQARACTVADMCIKLIGAR